MKRLLLAPLLIAGLQSPANAFPWSGDIVVKNDLGEKYIVKESTISINPWAKRRVVSALNMNDPIQQCVNRGVYSRDLCETSLESRKEEKRLEHQKLKDVMWKSKIETPLLEIKFRPILQDLNNKKSSGSYMTAICLNNDAIAKIDNKTEYSEALFAAMGIKRLRNYVGKKGTVAYELKRKVCDKYAKF